LRQRKTTTEGSERCERDQLSQARVHSTAFHLASCFESGPPRRASSTPLTRISLPLSKNRLDDWSIVGCIHLSCLNFWMKVCLPEFFEITRRANAAEIRKTQEIAGRETE
jgi:hypothetical protein